MGLEMFIIKKTMNVSLDQEKVTTTKFEGFNNVKPNRIMTIQEMIGWWYNFSPIDNWFYENVKLPTFNKNRLVLTDDDFDSEFEVSKEDFNNLLVICRTILSDNSSSNILLPIPDYEKSLDYDETYFNTILYSVNFLESIIEEMKSDSLFQHYYYQSNY